MVVREERQYLSEVIASYMRGEMDNFAFDEALDNRRWTDPVVKSIRWALWFTYCDVRRHQFRKTRSVWQAYRRIVAFLQTSLDLPTDEKRAVGEKCWPFQDLGSILAVRPDIEVFRLPGRAEILDDPPRPGALRVAWDWGRSLVMLLYFIVLLIFGAAYAIRFFINLF